MVGLIEKVGLTKVKKLGKLVRECWTAEIVTTSFSVSVIDGKVYVIDYPTTNVYSVNAALKVGAVF